VKIPAPDLESRVLLLAAMVLALSALRLSHSSRIADSGDITLLLCLAILLANFVVSGRHAASATALSFLSFGLLSWTHPPPAAHSMLAAVFHNFLLAFFGLGFALYAFGAIYAGFNLDGKAAPARRSLPRSQDVPRAQLTGGTVEGAQ
jgi:K+-sensing histidine kinase KdpD